MTTARNAGKIVSMPRSKGARCQETWEKIFDEEPYTLEELLSKDGSVGIGSSPYLPFVMKSLLPLDTVLEAGCGRAQWVLYLQNSGVRTIGVDFAVKAMQRTKNLHPQLALAGCDINKICFKDGSFDKVLCWSVIDHIETGPLPAVLEMCRVLKPQGILFITVPCRNLFDRLLRPFIYLKEQLCRSGLLRKMLSKATYQFEFFQREFTAEQFAALLKASGFHLLHVQPFSQEMGFARSVNRLLPKDSKVFFKNKTGPWCGLSGPGDVLCRIAKAISPWLTPDEILAIATKR